MRLDSNVSSGCAGGGYKRRLGFDFGAASTNNGNLLGQDVTAAAGYVFEQTYTYDGVNRLASASEVKAGSGATWSRTYGYDHFGNRWISANTGDMLHMATPTSASDIQATTNRLTGTGIQYDAAGNLTAHPDIAPNGAMAYDANNKMKTFDATGVDVDTFYDAAGRRVRKTYNGETTIWVYDAFGRLAAEYTTEVSTTDEVVYRTTDHLGSTRVTTDALGEVVQRRDYYPFGESILANATNGDRHLVSDGGFATYNASLGMRQQFTGQQRDEETGLDYFWARNYVTPCGRFSSIDQSNRSLNLADPQSWDRYNYVLNRPMVGVDPDGHASVFAVAGLSCAGGAAAGFSYELVLQMIEIGDGTRVEFDERQMLEVATGTALGSMIATTLPFAGQNILAPGTGGYYVFATAASIGGTATTNEILGSLGIDDRQAESLGEVAITGTMDAAQAEALGLVIDGACARAGVSDRARIALKVLGQTGLSAVDNLAVEIGWDLKRRLEEFQYALTGFYEDIFAVDFIQFYTDSFRLRGYDVQVTLFGSEIRITYGEVVE